MQTVINHNYALGEVVYAIIDREFRHHKEQVVTKAKVVKISCTIYEIDEEDKEKGFTGSYILYHVLDLEDSWEEKGETKYPDYLVFPNDIYKTREEAETQLKKQDI